MSDSLFPFSFFKLWLKGLQREVDGFLEGVGHFRCEEVGASGHGEFYTRLFVFCCFWLYESEIYLGAGYEVISACDFFDLLVDEGNEFVGDVEMNRFDLYLHNSRVLWGYYDV